LPSLFFYFSFVPSLSFSSFPPPHTPNFLSAMLYLINDTLYLLRAILISFPDLFFFKIKKKPKNPRTKTQHTHTPRSAAVQKKKKIFGVGTQQKPPD